MDDPPPGGKISTQTKAKAPLWFCPSLATYTPFMKRLSHVKVLPLPSVADPAPAATPMKPLKLLITGGVNGPGLPQNGPGLSTGPGDGKGKGPYPFRNPLKGIRVGKEVSF